MQSMPFLTSPASVNRGARIIIDDGRHYMVCNSTFCDAFNVIETSPCYDLQPRENTNGTPDRCGAAVEKRA